MTIDKKKKKIAEISKEQLSYIEKIVAVGKLPEPKRPSTKTKRAFRVIAYAIKLRQLATQKQKVRATPTDECLLDKTIAMRNKILAQNFESEEQYERRKKLASKTNLNELLQKILSYNL